MQFNMLTQKCFNACANDFSRRSLTEKEVRPPVPRAMPLQSVSFDSSLLERNHHH